MRQNLRQSIFTRMAALGFVFLTLLSNLWFIYFLTGQVQPNWLSHGVELTIGLLVISAVGMAVRGFQLSREAYTDDDSTL